MGDIVQRLRWWAAKKKPPAGMPTLPADCAAGADEIERLRAALAAAPAPTITAKVAALEKAIAKINDIRNSIIGFQKVNWSEHIYPLVAALEEAGIEGAGYPSSRENVGTMLERTLAAENEASVFRAALEEIINPIDAMKLQAKVKGAMLDGMMANTLARDPSYLKGIARAALATTEGSDNVQ